MVHFKLQKPDVTDLKTEEGGRSQTYNVWLIRRTTFILSLNIPL